jgi:23S rRNA pseudouridine2604 synthase
MLIRLNKFLSESGLCSRRGADEFIEAGEVKVNGLKAQVGAKVDPDKDRVEYKGKELKRVTQKIVIMLNKPVGYTCTARNFKDEKNVFDLVKEKERLFPVGRLDKDSSGLLLLTNDGDLALQLTHPRYEKEKEYEVLINKPLQDKDLRRMQQGMALGTEKSLPAKVNVINEKKFNIVLKEGKKRQIRRMAEILGYQVLALKRIRINSLSLCDLKVGEYKILNKEDLAKLEK